MHAVVRGRIERASTKALGLETSVGSVSLGTFTGDFGLSTFTVDDPEGFDADRFLILDEDRLSVGLRSILSDTVTVRRLTLTGIELTLELQDAGMNFRPVVANLKETERQGDGGPSKRLVIAELAISGVRASVRAASARLGIDEQYRIEAPDVVLRGVGGEGGVSLEQLTSVVVTRVLEAVMHSGELPSAIRNALGEGIADLIERHRGLATRAGVESAVEKAAEEAADRAKKKLGNYLDNN